MVTMPIEVKIKTIEADDIFSFDLVSPLWSIFQQILQTCDIPPLISKLVGCPSWPIYVEFSKMMSHHNSDPLPSHIIHLTISTGCEITRRRSTYIGVIIPLDNLKLPNLNEPISWSLNTISSIGSIIDELLTWFDEMNSLTSAHWLADIMLLDRRASKTVSTLITL
mgnify:CR=1 FL=1